MTRPSDWDDFDDDEAHAVDDRQVKIGKLSLGDQFVYEFDFGDSWHHLCVVEDRRIDPLEVLGIVPAKPLPFWGWGELPDQYGRRWLDDDGDSRPPADIKGADLPAIGPWQWRR